MFGKVRFSFRGSKNLYLIYNRKMQATLVSLKRCTIELYTKNRNGLLELHIETQDMLDTLKDSRFDYYSGTKEVDYSI